MHAKASTSVRSPLIGTIHHGVECRENLQAGARVPTSGTPPGPYSAYTCPSPGATARIIPLLPLDATRSSPCRRLGYIVTEGPATTSSPCMHMGHQPRRHPSRGPLLPTRVHCPGRRADSTPPPPVPLGRFQKSVSSRLGYTDRESGNGPQNYSGPAAHWPAARLKTRRSTNLAPAS